MAGAGFRTFVDGDVLTAAQVNTYLMEQAVMVFANASARTTALPTPSEGMVSYLADTNVLEVYTGAAWVSLDDPNAIQNTIVDAKGDIITATADNTPARLAVGTNNHRLIANSGQTTGLQWVADTQNTVVDAKGDLLVGTAADTVARLAVGGTNGHVLTVDSSTGTGLAWAAVAAGGGKVLQVVQASTTTATTVSSTTMTDTSLTANITPTAATSRVLVIVQQNFYISRTSSSLGAALRIMRGATAVFTLDDGAGSGAYYFNSTASGFQTVINVPMVYLDSPNTTSSTTYKTQGQIWQATNSHQAVFQNGSAPSTITLIEIGA